ncbi:MAG: DUF6249 domain-containing protein [Candidatus Fermentibacteria bacterium]|nr:DUF6249 domain-containing protein [Candidatus Fermentibacteria bacterium]
MDALIPIVAITTTFGVPAAVIIIALFISHKRKMARYNVIERAIESNANPEVIEQLVASIGEEDNKRRTPPRQRNLIHGTILMALGLGFFILRFIIGGTDIAGMLAIGAILIMLAIAKFIIAFFILKKDPEQL